MVEASLGASTDDDFFDELFFLLLLLLLLSLRLFFIPFSPPPLPLGFGDMSTSPSLGDFASQESKAAPGDFAI